MLASAILEEFTPRIGGRVPYDADQIEHGDIATESCCVSGHLPKLGAEIDPPERVPLSLDCQSATIAGFISAESV